MGSLFTGVGGFDLGLERAGHEIVWQVENNSQCQSVLRKHFNVDLHGDVKDVGRTNLASVDLICGGFPCQDLSIAGRREGLAGERSGLWYEFHRIVSELLPSWICVENVVGLLSSNEGRDMGVLIDGLVELGYGWSYRVLDSQYFGVPQRRRRVFIVGHLGGVCRPEVLLESEGMFGNPPKGDEAGEDIATALRTRSASGHDELSGGAYWNGSQVTHPLCVSSLGKGQMMPDKNRFPVVVTTLDATSLAKRTDRGTRVVESYRKATKQPDYDRWEETTTTGTLTSHDLEGDSDIRTVDIALVNSVPRRLTPRECERLQGFPDDWTRYADDGAELVDGHRYRMMGNAVTVPVIEWLGRRLALCDE